MKANIGEKWISREEIKYVLQDIRGRIGKDSPEVLHNELDEVFTYKPIDNYYILVRGEVYLFEKNYNSVFEILSNKELWFFPGPYAPLLAELQYKAALECGAVCNAFMQKIFLYYTYLATQTEMNAARNIYYNEDVVNDARCIFEEECQKKRGLIGKLLDFDFTSMAEILYSTLDSLFYRHYNLQEDIQAFIILAARENICKKESEVFNLNRLLYEFQNKMPNIGYISRELLQKNDDKVILLVDDINSSEDYKILCKCLISMGKECIIIDKPIRVDLNYCINIKETVAISMDNQEVFCGYTIIYPVELFLDSKLIGLNTFEIVEFLLETKSDYFNLITSNKMIMQMRKYSKLENKVQNLAEYNGEVFENFIVFGYLGNYNAYISRIYGFDYMEGFLKDECKLSIVIPARNSAYTLQYTIETCLKQRHCSDFEIVISDNSDEGNLEVKNLVDRLGDSRVKYFKTPVLLPLQKSFEFAYVKARGTYILPIGSDDGVMPWTTEVLNEMFDKYPENNVIGWERGFFQWSESENSQRGKLIIANYYKKGEFNHAIYDGWPTLQRQIDQDASSIYGIPIMYINTAFKRSYLKELYEKTGALLDGFTQDICMGIKSMLTNNDFVFLNYPLTLAAISDASLGARMISLSDSDSRLTEKISNETVTGYGHTVIDSDSPFLLLTSTEGMFFGEIFRIRKLSPYKKYINELLKDHNWEKSFEVLFNQIDFRDVSYMRRIEMLRYNAYQIGLDTGKWFDSTIYNTITHIACKIKNSLENTNEDNFETGFLNNSLTLDAKKFGVKTVAEAVQLFADITNL